MVENTGESGFGLRDSVQNVGCPLDNGCLLSPQPGKCLILYEKPRLVFILCGIYLSKRSNAVVLAC